MTAHVPPLYLRVKDACAAAGIGRTTLYALIKAGMPVRRIGKRCTLIRPDDLVRAIESAGKQTAPVGLPVGLEKERRMDDTKAPERIWVNLDSNEDGCCPVEDDISLENIPDRGRFFHLPSATEYVRADLLADMTRQRDALAAALILAKEALVKSDGELASLGHRETQWPRPQTRTALDAINKLGVK